MKPVIMAMAVLFAAIGNANIIAIILLIDPK
jgi:hypothetical protein